MAAQFATAAQRLSTHAGGCRWTRSRRGAEEQFRRHGQRVGGARRGDHRRDVPAPRHRHTAGHLDIAGTAWRGGSNKAPPDWPVGLLTHFVLAQAAWAGNSWISSGASGGRVMTEVMFHVSVPDRLAYACRLLRKANAAGAVVVSGPPPAGQARCDALVPSIRRAFVPTFGDCRRPVAARLRDTPVWLVDRVEQAPHHEVLVQPRDELVSGFEGFVRWGSELVPVDDEPKRGARLRWKHAQRGYPLRSARGGHTRDRIAPGATCRAPMTEVIELPLPARAPHTRTVLRRWPPRCRSWRLGNACRTIPASTREQLVSLRRARG